MIMMMTIKIIHDKYKNHIIELDSVFEVISEIYVDESRLYN
jgi:hypothetical protein